MSSSSEPAAKRVARSLLFVPGDRPDRFDKAAASGADEVVIDLEDAVSPTAKVVAREAAIAWLQAGRSACLRINAAGTPWFDDDLKALQSLPGTSLMLPKADVEALNRATTVLPGRRVVALIETVRGYMELRQLAAIGAVARIAFGSVDFGVESGIADEGDAMTAVRTQIVLESCFAGLEPPVDGVSVNFSDEEQMACDAHHTRQLGFGGKLCIHPRQVAAVNAAYCPALEEVDWAQRVVAAFELSDGGVTTVDGKMVDKPVVEQALRILADAER